MKKTLLLIILFFLPSCGLNPNHEISKYLQRGTKQINLQNYHKAVVVLEEGLRKYPQSEQIHFMLITAYLGDSGFEFSKIFTQITAEQTLKIDIPINIWFSCGNEQIFKVEDIDPICMIFRLMNYLPRVEGQSFQKARSLFISPLSTPDRLTRSQNFLLGVSEIMDALFFLGKVIRVGVNVSQTRELYVDLDTVFQHCVRVYQSTLHGFLYLQNSFKRFQLSLGKTEELKIKVGETLYSVKSKKDFEKVLGAVNKLSKVDWLVATQMTRHLFIQLTDIAKKYPQIKSFFSNLQLNFRSIIEKIKSSGLPTKQAIIYIFNSINETIVKNLKSVLKKEEYDELWHTVLVIKEALRDL
ncbi:MAG: hypothetical protein CL678_12385 [Bdellovibrionaceae bacterium]|nr:hypothetical protein [Pseudobdellovibrionaceae bacterium]|tara:strand:+ start:54 stop:1118 length:1065 start_codon:yes stop_codon:yes gene_type:complete